MYVCTRCYYLKSQQSKVIDTLWHFTCRSVGRSRHIFPSGATIAKRVCQSQWMIIKYTPSNQIEIPLKLVFFLEIDKMSVAKPSLCVSFWWADRNVNRIDKRRRIPPKEFRFISIFQFCIFPITSGQFNNSISWLF